MSGAKPGLSHKRKNIRLGMIGSGFLRRVLVLKRAGSDKETEGSSCLICTLVSLLDQMKENGMGGACSMCWRECIQFW